MKGAKTEVCAKTKSARESGQEGAAAILEAAGGRLTAIDGTPSIYNKGGLASNGLVHDALVTLLAGGEQAAPA